MKRYTVRLKETKQSKNIGDCDTLKDAYELINKLEIFDKIMRYQR